MLDSVSDLLPRAFRKTTENPLQKKGLSGPWLICWRQSPILDDTYFLYSTP